MKKGVRKSNSKGIHIHLTNRWLYTLIAIGILAIVGVVIYADAPSSTIPNPGHPISDLQTCNTAGDVLQINSTGQWSCVPASSLSSSSPWIATSGSTITYGFVSLTNNTPSSSNPALTVNGYTVVNGDLHITGQISASNFHPGGNLVCTSGGTLVPCGPSCSNTPLYLDCSGSCSSTTPISTCSPTITSQSSCGYKGNNILYYYTCPGSSTVYTSCGSYPSCPNPTSICGYTGAYTCQCSSGQCPLYGNLLGS
ncbi:MAG: hypothetical protein KGH55_02475 [Nanoarchaeota archaeon]|nr:hypothetical protein [Nanoarchaeota archaeon]